MLRRGRLAIAGLCVGLACADAPPSLGEAETSGVEATPEPDVQPPEAPKAPVDPLLARARASMQGGRVPASLRRELLASSNPHHRHAARLLQAVADEDPEPVLSRAGALPVADGEEIAAETGQPAGEPAADSVEPVEDEQPRPEPPARVEEPPKPAPKPIPAPPEEEELAVGDPRPELARLPADAPLRLWYADLLELEAAREADAKLDGEDPAAPEGFDLWTAVVGEPPLLASLPPPPSAPRELSETPDPSLAVALVILTRLSLEPVGGGEGDGDGEGEGAVLTLAGAGSVEVSSRLIASQRWLVWIDGAGAVPSFSSARPRLDDVAVVDVRRNQTRVELELELAPGWSLVDAEPLENGARLRFSPVSEDEEGSAP